MLEKDYMKKKYKSFKEFLGIACSRELEYFIFDSQFTSAFNYRMKKLSEEVKDSGKDNISFSVIFNTEDEVAIIDASIVGSYISNNFVAHMENKYKGIVINKIIKNVINGKEKNKQDFIIISYDILYKTLEELYKDIKYNKEVLNKYIKEYKLEENIRKDIPIVVCSLLILEDMCAYLSIHKEIFLNVIDKAISSKRV